MADKKQSDQQVPDPARSYERAKPQAESGMGRLDNNQATPTNRPDRIEKPVKNRQSSHQVNAEDVVNERAAADPKQPDHSMLEEEPLGWDQAPADIKNPRAKRHPRKEGKGGLA